MTAHDHHPTTLTRRNALIAASMLAASASLTRGSPSVLARQGEQATPAVQGGVELAPGVWAEVFAGVPSARAEGQTLYLGRFTFFPGSELFRHSHPGTTLVSVESGTLDWTLVAGTVYVVRGAAADSTETAEEFTEAGFEVVLEAGDALYYEDDVVHTARCAGDAPAILFGALVLTSGEPLLMPMD